MIHADRVENPKIVAKQFSKKRDSLRDPRTYPPDLPEKRSPSGSCPFRDALSGMATVRYDGIGPGYGMVRYRYMKI